MKLLISPATDEARATAATSSMSIRSSQLRISKDCKSTVMSSSELLGKSSEQYRNDMHPRLQCRDQLNFNSSVPQKRCHADSRAGPYPALTQFVS